MNGSAARIGALTPRWGRRRRPSRWAWLVAGSTVILAAVVVGMGALWAATWDTRSTTSTLPSAVSRVELDIGPGDVEILGGSPLAVGVRRDERSAYGRRPTEERTLEDGVLRIRTRCPKVIVGSCSADYRITMPDNVPVEVVSETGSVRMTSYRGSAAVTTRTGDVTVETFCGFSLRATTETGRIRVGTVCAPERLELRTGTGAITAFVPPGRYRLDTDTRTGRTDVRGVVADDEAPWLIQALSTSGDVRVEAAP